MQTDTLILIVAAGAALVAAIFAGMSWIRTKDASGSEVAINQKIDSEMRHTREQSQVAVDGLDRRLVTMTDKVDSLERAMADFQAKTSKELGDVRVAQEKGRADMQAGISTTLKGVQDSVSQQLIAIRQDNGKSLEQIRATVDDKLQKTLNDRISKSFEMVNNQLEAVSKGLGEMRGMAESVGDLRKVLSNVKTRGIVGEVQLGAILEEVLSPEQYDTNVVTVPGSSNRVEFAVKIPGKDDEFVYLPIDAKFPGETYGRLEDAKDTGDAASVETAWKELENRLKSEAKDIHEKYVAPPATTSFAILFLPFEGLYAEVVNRVRGWLSRYNANGTLTSQDRLPWQRCSTPCKWAFRPWQSKSGQTRYRRYFPQLKQNFLSTAGSLRRHKSSSARLQRPLTDLLARVREQWSALSRV